MHCTQMVFEGLAGCVRERKIYQKHTNNGINSFPKSVENRCENDSRKSDAEIMGNGANMESKRYLTFVNKSKKYIPKIMLKYDTKSGQIWFL